MNSASSAASPTTPRAPYLALTSPAAAATIRRSTVSRSSWLPTATTASSSPRTRSLVSSTACSALQLSEQVVEPQMRQKRMRFR